jgi:hypothetical protein
LAREPGARAADVTPPPPREAALAEVVAALRECGATAAGAAPAIAFRCAICGLAEQSAARSLRALFAEFVNDPKTRLRFRAARGFCREHTPILLECGDALGVSMLYADLADAARERWRAGLPSPKRGLIPSRSAARESAPCPACETEAEAETRYCAALAAGLQTDAALWQTLDASRGLCARHIERTAAAARPADAARLLEMEARGMDVLYAELEEFIRKNDYRFRGEPWGAERDAWRRALARLRRP